MKRDVSNPPALRDPWWLALPLVMLTRAGTPARSLRIHR